MVGRQEGMRKVIVAVLLMSSSQLLEVIEWCMESGLLPLSSGECSCADL